jgi:hypothetical protein
MTEKSSLKSGDYVAVEKKRDLGDNPEIPKFTSCSPKSTNNSPNRFHLAQCQAPGLGKIPNLSPKSVHQAGEWWVNSGWKTSLRFVNWGTAKVSP